MRTLSQFLDAYAESHQNPLNQVIHMICVPAIFFATLALLWLVPVGRLIPGLSADLAVWINLATLLMPAAALIYVRLSLGSFLIGMAWAAISLGLILSIQHAGLPLFAIAALIWVIAWAVQIYGHHVEGAKPSFIDDLVFLLIGPLFVQHKLHRLIRHGSLSARTH